jgi:hypothetical protein
MQVFHARDAGDRALFDALVAVDALRLLVDVGLVRERDRLFGLRPDREERTRRFAHRPMRRREDRRGGRWLGAAGDQGHEQERQAGSPDQLRYNRTRSAGLQACQRRRPHYFACKLRM